MNPPSSDTAQTESAALIGYALSGTTHPISVADWATQFTRSLPDVLRSSLPSIEELERELNAGDVGEAEAGRAGV